MNKKLVFIVVGIIVLILAWYLISPLFIVKEVNEESPLDELGMDKETEDMPNSAVIIAEADFMESAHTVSGKALVIEEDGKKILRFEDFETVNGPNLHIYLSSDLSSNDFIDLGAIKATKGNVNYEIPEGTDLEKYNKVLVWCVPFKVLFSYSDLQ